MKPAFFLRASWEYLAMVNYLVDPKILKPYLPPYTEIDFYEDKCYVSLVGFLFNDTRVLGVRWPGFVNFEEVNLRFYVKRHNGRYWERGVAFISEIVPKRLIALLANSLYNERYATAVMDHSVKETAQELKISYKWKKAGERWNHLHIHALNEPRIIEPGTLEEFIFEHYVGFNRLRSSAALKYMVEHPRWNVLPVTHCEVHCRIDSLYGQAFVPFLENVTPDAVFLAIGSPVRIGMPKRVDGPGILS